MAVEPPNLPHDLLTALLQFVQALDRLQILLRARRAYARERLGGCVSPGIGYLVPHPVSGDLELQALGER
jgi:hypothetical protein